MVQKLIWRSLRQRGVRPGTPANALTCALCSLLLTHHFLACVDTIVLFFSQKKQGIPLMTEHQLSLLPFYAGWGIYNQHLAAAIAPLTQEQLALRNTPQHWSIGMYA